MLCVSYHHTFKNSPIQTLSSGTLKLFYSNNAIPVLHHRPFLFGFILCVTFVTRWSCFLTVSVELYELMNFMNLCGNRQHIQNDGTINKPNAPQQRRCIPYRRSQICSSRRYNFMQILSAGIAQLTGFDISLSMPVADSSRPPT